LEYKTYRTLHHLTTHQTHGTITGLAALRTIDSGIDGLDRLLVSFRDAKLAILEWSRGDIATVSLHTYERCPQMTTGDMSTYVPRLRTDPLSRIALLSLPDDGLAVLPIIQEQSDLDMNEAFPRYVRIFNPANNQRRSVLPFFRPSPVRRITPNQKSRRPRLSYGIQFTYSRTPLFSHSDLGRSISFFQGYLHP
jgi:hypothetical protein